MNDRNPQKKSKKSAPKPSSALRLRIDEQGFLRARVSASSGEYNLSPEILHILCLLEQGVAIPTLASKLRQDFRDIVNNLPQQSEIVELVQALKEAQCVVDATDGTDALGGALDGFGDSWIQWAMLADKPRCTAYQKAISQTVGSKANVVDVGAGTGLLSLFALAAGARRVDAIEETSSVKILNAVRQSLPANDKERFRIHNKNSADVELPADVTHVVSELFGNDPLQEGVIPTLRDVFSRLANGKLQGIPESVEVIVQCAELQDGPLRGRLEKLWTLGSDENSEWGQAIAKIRKQLRFDDVSFAHPVRASDLKQLEPLKTLFKIPLAPPPAAHIQKPNGRTTFKTPKQLSCPVILLCFRAHLSKDISISNIPGQPDQCDHWSPIVVPLMRLPEPSEHLDISASVGAEWERVTIEIKNSRGETIGARK